LFPIPQGFAEKFANCKAKYIRKKVTAMPKTGQKAPKSGKYVPINGPKKAPIYISEGERFPPTGGYRHPVKYKRVKCSNRKK
jgi:hypothetical protein